MSRVDALGELALGAVDAHELGLDGDGDARGHGDGLPADAAHAHHQTCATTSPPTPASRASWPVITPLRRGHDRGAHAAEDLGDARCGRRSGAGPGRETRLRPEMAERRSSVYLSVTRMSSPGCSAVGASISKSLDVALLLEDAGHLALEPAGAGSRPSWCAAVMPLRIAGQEVGDGVGHRHAIYQLALRHAGDVAVVRELAQADAAHAELAVDRARRGRSGGSGCTRGSCTWRGAPGARAGTSWPSGLALSRSRLLGLSRTGLPSRLNGMPNASSSA